MKFKKDVKMIKNSPYCVNRNMVINTVKSVINRTKRVNLLESFI
jgi:hypothetical protein